jgi:hypothetical protein
MDCQKIESIINDLKVDSLGRIRGKNKVIDKIHSAHLTNVDNTLSFIRIQVAKLGNSEDLKKVDEIIYKVQVSA